MTLIEVNGVEICYDEFGSPDDPTVVLIAGLLAQLTSWKPGFCQLLVDKGLRVIRFDNRDAGLSSKTDGPFPSLVPKTDPEAPGPAFTLTEPPPYTVEDMASDALGVMDHLGIQQAHVVGVSMGGIVGQVLATLRPDRVLSLASIMSTTGDAAVGEARPEAAAIFFEPVEPTRESAIEHGVKAKRTVSGRSFDEATARDEEAAAFDRCYHPAGRFFQIAAVASAGDRTESLGAIRCPTVVIHGAEDPLVAPSGGRATADAIPNAELVIIDGMGHDLSAPLWPTIVDALWTNMRRADLPAER